MRKPRSYVVIVIDDIYTLKSNKIYACHTVDMKKEKALYSCVCRLIPIRGAAAAAGYTFRCIGVGVSARVTQQEKGPE